MEAFLVVYLVVLQGLGSAIIDAGVNFGVATAMYKNKGDVSVWKLPDSLAGDAAVTCIVQTVLTWLIAGMLVRTDVKHNRVQTFEFKTGSFVVGSQPFFSWLLGSGSSKLKDSWLLSLLSSIARGFLFSVIFGLVLWPFAALYLSIAFADEPPGSWPNPQIFKAVFGAILGFLSTPVIAAIILNEEHRKLVLGEEFGGLVQDTAHA